MFDTSITRAAPVDNDTAVAFSVAHTALCYSSEQNNYWTTNGCTNKLSVIMNRVFKRGFCILYFVISAEQNKQRIISRCKSYKHAAGGVG